MNGKQGAFIFLLIFLDRCSSSLLAVDMWGVFFPSTYLQPSGSFISNKPLCYHKGIVPISGEPPHFHILFYGVLIRHEKSASNQHEYSLDANQQ
jgi:hypothetical protein